MKSLNLSRTPCAYFYLAENPQGGLIGYPHLAIVVAEGLCSLGWNVSSNLRAWKSDLEAGELFPGPVLQPEECDLIVFSEDFFFYQQSPELPDGLKGHSVPAIYLDRTDLGRVTRYIYLPAFRRFTRIYRTHYNRRFRYPQNVRAFQFGISDRIAAGTSGTSGILTPCGSGRRRRFALCWRVLSNLRQRPMPSMRRTTTLS